MVLAVRNSEFAEALTERRAVSEDQLTRALTAADATSRRLETTLLELGILPEEQLARLLSDWLDLPLLHADQVSPHVDPDWDLADDYLTSHRVCPALSEEGDAILLMADPRDEDVLRVVSYAAQRPFTVAVATVRDITTAIQKAVEPETAQTGLADVSARDIDQLAQSATEGPIVRLVQAILLSAIDRKASDIHVEADPTGGAVRFRIDGNLDHERRLSEAEVKAVQSRLKIMAGLNISEARRPQDGRVRQTLRGVAIDFRLSTLPTQFGESLVLRVLDQSARPLDLAELGFTADRVAKLDRMFNRTEGLFLVTGPTGSGKTTTLYTGLSRLNAAENKIITIEDPIEYTLDGICQTQVHPEIGYDFSQALRAVLRQDINVVLVGEIRDPETAQQAVRISMTGRLVVSTLHTATAVGAVDRLRDLAVPDYLLATTLCGVLSQRLVRRADGNGRTVVSELFEVGPDAADGISNGCSARELAKIATNAGFESIQFDGARLIDAGEVTEADFQSVLLRD